MTNFIDLICCFKLNSSNSYKIFAYAPMSALIKKGDIVRIDGMKGFYLVTCKITVAKGSDSYNFITEALGPGFKVTDKYSHQEIGGTENE